MSEENKKDNLSENNAIEELLEKLDDYVYMRPDEFYNGTVNYETREIVIAGVIDESSVQNYIMPIIRINLEDDINQVEITERIPIRIYFACDGGETRYGLSLINVIKASKTPIIGINISHAYSMGAIIFMSCPTRLSYKYSTFMIHDGMMGAENSVSKLKDTLNFHLNTIEELIKTIILENSKISKKILTDNYSKEWYFTAEDGVKYGFVDEIISEIL